MPREILISRQPGRKHPIPLTFPIRLLAIGLLAAITLESVAVEPSGDGVDFFEKQIRPVLVQHCYGCHSAEANAKGKLEAGLLLDTRQGLLAGGESGPAIVPGDAGRSLLIAALRYETYEMPPPGKLPDEVIADFVRWIDRGASDPRDGSAPPLPRREAFRITDEDRRHWAFQPLHGGAPPRVAAVDWCRNEFDRFVLTKLEGAGLRPAPATDKYALLRRAAFGITGLPPQPDEIAAFLADDSPEAFERVVDRLLASPAFGVHWARHWLDGVRYASDVDKTGAYRDWVVRAFNDDLPYDRFLQFQLAGDLLPAGDADPAARHASGASLDGVTATGMLALAIWEQVGLDLAVAEIVDSQIDVVGRQLLGLTLACARCHDHKYDPVSTEDYYALGGIFFSSRIATGKIIADGRLANEVIDVPLLTAADAERNRQIDVAIGEIEGSIAAISANIPQAARLMAVREQLPELDAQIAKATGDGKKSLVAQAAKLRDEQRKLLDDQQASGWRDDPPELEEITARKRQIGELRRNQINAPTVIAVQDGGVVGSNREGIRDVPVYVRGEYRREGPVVPRRIPEIFAGDGQIPIGQRTRQSGRLELAQWITSADHPLTARVMANRVWRLLVGEGIVRTPDNFGRLGDPPTHPELLDHLARRFVASGWSVKELIRSIVSSGTYRQSSSADPEAIVADPENRTLSRMNRHRLTYEEFRDALLVAGGQLPGSTGSVVGGGRRTLFEPIERRKVDVTSAIFDGPDPRAIVAARAQTTTAPQALFLMNNPLVAEVAGRLADEIRYDSARTDTERLDTVWLAIVGRLPAAWESERARDFVARASWAHLIQTLLCTNEFAYLD